MIKKSRLFRIVVFRITDPDRTYHDECIVLWPNVDVAPFIQPGQRVIHEIRFKDTPHEDFKNIVEHLRSLDDLLVGNISEFLSELTRETLASVLKPTKKS